MFENNPVVLLAFDQKMVRISFVTCVHGISCDKILKALESQSKPGTKMVDPEPCKELRRQPHLILAGIVPY